MIPCPVATCERPRRGDENICGACATDLARALGDVPFLARQLDITLSKQDTRTGGSGEADDDLTPATLHITPLAYDQRASEAAETLHNTLVGWVRVLIDDRDPLYGPTCKRCDHASCAYIRLTKGPADDLAAMSRWLLAHHKALLRHPAAVEIHDEITAAVQLAEQAVDRPAERWFAGPCDCGEDLYAKPGATLVRCRGCGVEHGINARREWLLAAIEDTLATAAQAEHILTLLDWPVAAGRIRTWGSRGRIVAHGVDQQGRPLYRVGDIREMLSRAAERAEDARARKAAKAVGIADRTA